MHRARGDKALATLEGACVRAARARWFRSPVYGAAARPDAPLVASRARYHQVRPGMHPPAVRVPHSAVRVGPEHDVQHQREAHPPLRALLARSGRVDVVRADARAALPLLGRRRQRHRLRLRRAGPRPAGDQHRLQVSARAEARRLPAREAVKRVTKAPHTPSKQQAE
eukprot:3939506-Prymnesium_polylepis.1